MTISETEALVVARVPTLSLQIMYDLFIETSKLILHLWTVHTSLERRQTMKFSTKKFKKRYVVLWMATMRHSFHLW